MPGMMARVGGPALALGLSAALAGLLAPSCSRSSQSAAEPAPHRARSSQAVPPLQQQRTAEMSDMSDIDTALNEVNRILAEHPASEKICGEQQSTLSRDGSRLVLDIAWSKCPGVDRRVAEAGELEFGRLYDEVVPEYGQARMYIPCAGDRACSGRFQRKEGQDEWLHQRDEAVFTVDCAPEKAVLKELEAAVGKVIEAMNAG